MWKYICILLSFLLCKINCQHLQEAQSQYPQTYDLADNRVFIPLIPLNTFGYPAKLDQYQPLHLKKYLLKPYFL